MRLRSSRRGAGLGEMGILVGLVAVLAIFGVSLLGDKIAAVFTSTDGALGNAVALADGAPAQSARASCKAILDAGESTGDGRYRIDPNGGNPSDAFEAWCDMTTDGGGWSLVMKTSSQNYDDPIWTQVSDLDAEACADPASPNTGACKIEALYEMPFSEMMATNHDMGTRAIIGAHPERSSLRDHLTGASLTDPRVMTFLANIYGVTGVTSSDYVGWNIQEFIYGQRTGWNRMLTDKHGGFGAGIGGTPEGSCGGMPTNGNWNCSTPNDWAVWFWIR